MDGGREEEGGHEVTEGDGVTFKCVVSADPPAYNITWLHNVSISTSLFNIYVYFCLFRFSLYIIHLLSCTYALFIVLFYNCFFLP